MPRDRKAIEERKAEETKRQRKALAAQFLAEVKAGLRKKNENFVFGKNKYGMSDPVPYEAIMNIEGQSNKAV